MDIKDAVGEKETVEAEETAGNVQLLTETEVRQRRGYLFAKRTFDIVVSFLALVVLFPFLLIFALAIVIDDPKGSPIFAQTRKGKNGKPFKLYKFRSMVVDAEKQLDDLLDKNEMTGPVFKIKDDPRITRVGKFYRRASIDELPQLWNVLKGDMSFVGPRPPLPREVDQYNEYQMQRLAVKPGLTCYWQIMPERNDIQFDEWLELDLKYIRERSVLVDLKIFFKTIGAVLHMGGR